ncbi:MAG: alpha/beta hydrolase [Verrucomicrobia bacterium]|nr:alpha/beta hydrolase [Verrucomicrobiota bacterium]
MPQSLKHQTFTYKTVGHLEIQAEVTRIQDDVSRPVLVWVHGGAMMKGDRFDQWKKEFPSMMLDAGYIIVSIDYRLAPESKLPALIEDVVDACAWVREEGPQLFGANTERLAVAGGSAGGYLSLAAACHIEPKPTVVASFYGYCDLVGRWATSPSLDPEHHETNLSKKEVSQFVPGPAISNKYERIYDITPYYNYWRQNGLWPFALSGWDPKSERDKYLSYLPHLQATSDYPPTILIHGTEDLDVAYQQSVQMAEALDSQDVPHQLILLEGAKHGFRGIETERVEQAHRKAMAFVRYRMED